MRPREGDVFIQIKLDADWRKGKSHRQIKREIKRAAAYQAERLLAPRR